MKKAMLQYAMAKYVTVIINLLITGILSRLLLPSDYGVVAIVMVFINFFNVISTMGLGTGVIQNQELDEEELNGIFSITVWIAIIMSILFNVLSFVVAYIYRNSIYIKLMNLLSLNIFFSALNVIPNAVILKKQRYREISLRMILSSLISGMLAVVVALFGGKYYALIIQNIISILIQFIGNQLSVRLRFKIKINTMGIKKIGGYSLFQFLYGIFLTISQNLDNLLTGKFLGNEQLAYYNKSYSLMRYPIDYIPHAISPVIHPILAKSQTKLSFIYIEYIKILKIMSHLGVFFSLLFILEAEEIIFILFGNQWKESVGVICIFGYGLWFQIINALAGAIYQSVNNTKNMFISGCIHIPVSIIAIVVGILHKNIEFLAFMLVLSWGIKFVIESYFLVVLSLKQNIIEYWGVFRSEFFTFIIIKFLCDIIFPYISYGLVLTTFIKTIIIVVMYVIFIVILKQYRYFLPLFRRK